MTALTSDQVGALRIFEFKHLQLDLGYDVYHLHGKIYNRFGLTGDYGITLAFRLRSYLDNWIDFIDITSHKRIKTEYSDSDANRTIKKILIRLPEIEDYFYSYHYYRIIQNFNVIDTSILNHNKFIDHSKIQVIKVNKTFETSKNGGIDKDNKFTTYCESVYFCVYDNLFIIIDDYIRGIMPKSEVEFIDYYEAYKPDTATKPTAFAHYRLSSEEVDSILQRYSYDEHCYYLGNLCLY